METTLMFVNAGYRARGLVAVAPQLIGEALARTLRAALTFANVQYRAEVLAALAPQLTGELLTQARS